MFTLIVLLCFKAEEVCNSGLAWRFVVQAQAVEAAFGILMVLEELFRMWACVCAGGQVARGHAQELGSPSQTLRAYCRMELRTAVAHCRHYFWPSHPHIMKEVDRLNNLLKAS